MKSGPPPDRAQAAILTLAQKRGPDKSCCPGEVARLLDPENWREQMEPVRAAAATLARQGQIRITQKGRAIDPASAKGPIRLSAVQ